MKGKMYIDVPYGPSYKALVLTIIKWPSTLKECFWVAWGTDVWFGCIPFCKSVLGLNVLVWAILLLA